MNLVDCMAVAEIPFMVLPELASLFHRASTTTRTTHVPKGNHGYRYKLFSVQM